jgi:hypothetical protein
MAARKDKQRNDLTLILLWGEGLLSDFWHTFVETLSGLPDIRPNQPPHSLEW